MSGTANIDTLKTISLDEVVTVPAGTYNCIHYQIKGEHSNLVFYIAPGIGMIQCAYRGAITTGIDIEIIPDTTWNIMKLERYKIK